MSIRYRLPAHIVRMIAVESHCDPRTVERVLRGERARGMVDDRIRRALEAHGYAPPS